MAILLVLFGMLVSLGLNFLDFARRATAIGARDYMLPTLFMLVWLTIMFGVIISSLSRIERVRFEGAWVAVTHGPFGIGRPKRFPIERISGVRLTELPYTKRAQSEGSYAMFGHRRALAFDCDGTTCYAFSGLRSSEGEDVLIRFRSLSGAPSSRSVPVDQLQTPHVVVSSSADGVTFDIRSRAPLPQRLQVWGMTPFLVIFAYVEYRNGLTIVIPVMYLALAVFMAVFAVVVTFGTRRLSFEREQVSSRLVLGRFEAPKPLVIPAADISAVEYITGEKKLKWNGGVKEAPGVHLRSARTDICVGQALDEAERKALYELIRMRSGLPDTLFKTPEALPEGA
jgi:hypothetical protein